MPDGQPTTLRNRDLELVLAPEVGGSIARFDRVGPDGQRIAILRGAGGTGASVLDMGSFPLVPYCNRIRDGRFTFRSREVVQLPNMVGDRSPLHGHAWLAAWTVEHAGECAAHLSYRHEAGEWPWRYEARQIFNLNETGLEMSLSCRNLATEPMPCGLGFHPYFHCTSETVLDTDVGDVWTVDEDILPVERIAALGRYDLRQRRICGQELDNGFSDWGGDAMIRTPGTPFSIRLSSPEARFFQLYAPLSGGVFVAEPVSHANAALNESEDRWPSLGLRVLEPGETMQLTARIDLVPAV